MISIWYTLSVYRVHCTHCVLHTVNKQHTHIIKSNNSYRFILKIKKHHSKPSYKECVFTLVTIFITYLFFITKFVRTGVFDVFKHFLKLFKHTPKVSFLVQLSRLIIFNIFYFYYYFSFGINVFAHYMLPIKHNS